ncbi:hypothetical protein Hanom_Chr17g01528891 [Helianthus anomalus]
MARSSAGRGEGQGAGRGQGGGRGSGRGGVKVLVGLSCSTSLMMLMSLSLPWGVDLLFQLHYPHPKIALGFGSKMMSKFLYFNISGGKVGKLGGFG